MPIVSNERSQHWANFLHAIDNRILPISDVHSHMKMLNTCHLAGITARLGRTIKWDDKAEQIVGDDEADVKSNLISINSPIARALIGKEEGEIAEVNTPGGIRALEIIEVKYI